MTKQAVIDEPNQLIPDVCETEKISMKPRIIYKGLLIPFMLLTACFALWGAANNMTDLLVPAFQKVLSMSQLQSSFIQSAFYGAYFIMALPAAFLIQKYSYKKGVLIGLSVYAIGALCCYPASQMMSFEMFLLAFYIFASGCAILETVAAPYIMSMGPEETATQRINLAQAFNPIGVLMGVFIGKEIILKGLNSANEEERSQMASEQLNLIQSQELSNVVVAYMIVAVVSLILVGLIAITKFPSNKAKESISELKNTFDRLRKNTTWKAAVVTQFFYVGCQIGVWTFAIKYIMDNNINITTESQAGDYVFYGLCVYTAFRFICTFLMSYIAPAKLLSIMAALASILMVVTVFVGGEVGTYALLLCFSCMSLMFPTIYGLGLQGTGDDRKLGGSFIIMAILGGAVLVPLQGALIDYLNNVNLSYLLPLFCFMVVFIFSLFAGKTNTNE